MKKKRMKRISVYRKRKWQHYQSKKGQQMAVNFGLQHQKHFPFIDTLPSGFHKLLHTHTHISIKHHRCFCCIFYLKNFTFLFMSATLSFHAQKSKINKSKRTLRNESTHIHRTEMFMAFHFAYFR